MEFNERIIEVQSSPNIVATDPFASFTIKTVTIYI